MKAQIVEFPDYPYEDLSPVNMRAVLILGPPCVVITLKNYSDVDVSSAIPDGHQMIKEIDVPDDMIKAAQSLLEAKKTFAPHTAKFADLIKD